MFSNVEHAGAVLRDRLPKALVEKVRWSTLRKVPGSFVKADLRQCHTDLLFSATLGGSSKAKARGGKARGGNAAYFYLLFEHQSTAERWMLLRLLDYMVQIWWEHLAKHPRTRKLPVVVPVVHHHSESGWQYDTSFPAHVEVPADTLSCVLPFIPRFECVLDDISHATDEELRDRAITELSKLVLALLRHSRNLKHFFENFRVWTDTYHEVRRTPHGLRALSIVLRYMFRVGSDLDSEHLHALLARAESADLAEDIVTLEEKLLKKGREEGHRSGHLEGRRHGAGDLVSKQLRLKFGSLPESAMARLRDASEAELDRFAERVLTANSLAEVLQG